MAYSKQTWDTTSYVNPTRMNHIEDGIESASTATGTEYSSGVSVKDKIDSLLKVEELLYNHYIQTANDWNNVSLNGDINNYDFLGFSFSTGDNKPAQSAMQVIIPVSEFKNSTSSNSVCVVNDFITNDVSKMVLVSYNGASSIRRYRGTNIYQYFRLSVYGISKK